MAALMPVESALHFPFVAVIRSDEIRTHKEEDYVCGIDVLVNCLAEILASGEFCFFRPAPNPLPAKTPAVWRPCNVRKRTSQTFWKI